MFVPWKLRWRWLFIGLVMVAIAFQVLSRFSFSQSSWAGNLQRLCGFNQSKFEKFSSPKAQFILDLKFSSEPGSEYEDAKRLLGLVDKHLRRDQVILFGGYEVLRNYKGRGVSLGYTALFSEGWNKYRFSLGHQFLLDRRRELKCDYLVLPSVFLNQSLIEES
ncbi:MAG: hypothetical protein QGG36_12705, partial [Pirellulaceae bacterium]|nr:hypothetical protein [Pirellulaceae bacterium]